MKKLFKKADFLLISIFCLVCAALFLPRFIGSDDLTAKIYQNGTEIHSINLSKVTNSYTIVIKSKPVSKIQVEKKAIGYIESDCPDKLCVNAGMLKRRGQTAACLPAKTVIVLTGGEKSEDAPDVITY